MWQFLDSVENSSFCTWVRESQTVWGYTTVLAFHTFGMAILVGLSAMIALRVLGFGRGLPLAPLERFFPLIWVGFWINAVSGVLLFSLTPTSFLTNITFGLKMLAVAAAVATVRSLQTNGFGDPASLDKRPVPTKVKQLAAAALAIWMVAVTAGRVSAYKSFVGRQTALALLIVAAVVFVVWYSAVRVLGLNNSARQVRPQASTGS